jgi:hypothetical protein
VKHIVKITSRLRDESIDVDKRLNDAMYHLGVTHGLLTRVKQIASFDLSSESNQKIYELIESYIDEGCL